MKDLPPGFRFFPTEEELVSFYLYNKVEGRREDLNRVMERIIPVLDIYEFDPADLPQISRDLCTIRDTEQWFFFMARQESEARGGRPKRLTTNGYWKATGSPGNVYSNNRCIGVKRTMVFYKGRAPNGTKTEWKMNEYKLVIQGDQASSSSTDANPRLRHEFSLCRVYKKSKCLRSFDRRPVGRLTEIGEMMRGQPKAEGGHEATTSSHNLLVGERLMSCSPDSSSSSGDQGNPDAPMSVNDETFLDWKQLDSWFAGGDDSQPK